MATGKCSHFINFTTSSVVGKHATNTSDTTKDTNPVQWLTHFHWEKPANRETMSNKHKRYKQMQQKVAAYPVPNQRCFRLLALQESGPTSINSGYAQMCA